VALDLNFESIFIDGPVPAIVLDRDLHFVAINDAHLAMTGKVREEVIGRYVFDVFPESPERVETLKETFRRTLAGERVTFEEIPYLIELNGKPVEHFFTARPAPLRGPSGGIDHLVQYSENVTDRVRLREMNEAVMGELKHRIGNLFTVVGSIARQVARKAEDVPDFLKRFNAQLSGFLNVQKGLIADAEGNRRLRDVVDEHLSLYSTIARDRIGADGPDISLTAPEAKAMSMVIHELSTNSLKYGSIRNPEGRLSVTWDRSAPGECRLVWTEDRTATTPQEGVTGQGTHLLTAILPVRLNGSADASFGEGTFRYELTFAPVT
jgi:PAS domain S-box-containing protein